jgi:hypothetical protein
MKMNQLDTLEGLTAAVGENVWQVGQSRVFEGGRMHCPTCGESRRMHVNPLFVPHKLRNDGIQGRQRDVDTSEMLPSLFIFQCVECKGDFTAVVYPGPQGHGLAVFPTVPGGLATARTVPAVAYYLDQASRSHSTGANSAAVAMYRAALEHLLFEQGFTKGMLAEKIKAMESKTTDPTAPKWVRELDTEYLTVLKDLGNGSIHPNGGDVTKQDALDRELLVKIEITFQALLYLVYEEPHKKAGSLSALKKAATSMKK